MEKYQNLTANIGIILKKTRLMEKYIHGFQIRKIFPFHLILGSPDWQSYGSILGECQKELKSQENFIKKELKKSNTKSINSYLQALSHSLPKIEHMIQNLINSNELHSDRFFNTKEVSLSELNQIMKKYQESEEDYLRHAGELGVLYSKLLKEN